MILSHQCRSNAYALRPSGHAGQRVGALMIEPDQEREATAGGKVLSMALWRFPGLVTRVIWGPSATDAQRVEHAAQLQYALLQLLDGFSERGVRGSRELARDDRD